MTTPTSSLAAEIRERHQSVGGKCVVCFVQEVQYEYEGAPSPCDAIRAAEEIERLEKQNALNMELANEQNERNKVIATLAVKELEAAEAREKQLREALEKMPCSCWERMHDVGDMDCAWNSAKTALAREARTGGGE